MAAGLAQIPTEALVLFIGMVFLGTLIISRFSTRFGIPAILGVLVLGLLMNIEFLDISHEEVERVDLFSLAPLLFYAGLKTDLAAIRGFLIYGLQLAIGGVLIAILSLGGEIYWLTSSSGGDLSPGLENTIPLGLAMLIASCLGSTDAGATLSVLEQVKRRVPERVQHLLEFESSVNDPSTLIIYGICTTLFQASSQNESLAGIAIGGLTSLMQQLGTGLLVGLTFGFVAKVIIDCFVPDQAQLLIVAMSIAFMDYGCAFFLGGSGCVAVYVTGVAMTNAHYRKPEFSHESIQETLVPSLSVGFVTAGVLMLVARPLSVLVFQKFSPFNGRDSTLIAWCGLRGAVPLALSFSVVQQIPRLRSVTPEVATTLATNAQSIVFIVVILNLLLQGLSLPPLCRWLNAPSKPEWSL